MGVNLNLNCICIDAHALLNRVNDMKLLVFDVKHKGSTYWEHVFHYDNVSIWTWSH